MTTSGVLSRIRSALGRAHHISTASAKGNPSNKPSTPAPEGAIPFTVDGEIHQTWYRVCGDFASSKSAPLVVVHGGPGMAHDYLIPVSGLQKRSDLDLFVDELINLLDHSASAHDTISYPRSFSNETFKELSEEIQEDLKLGFKDNITKEIASAVLDPIFGDRETGGGGDPTVSIAMNMGALAGWTIVDGLHKINRSNSFVELESRYDAGLCVPMWGEREKFMEVVEHFLESED